MEPRKQTELYCGTCRRALRSLSRHRKVDEDGLASKVRTDEQWLRSKAHDAVAYRATMVLFKCATLDAVRRLSSERFRLFQQAWTRYMLQLLPDAERHALREAMERRQGRKLPELFDIPPESLLP